MALDILPYLGELKNEYLIKLSWFDFKIWVNIFILKTDWTVLFHIRCRNFMGNVDCFTKSLIRNTLG